ncbi:hypothetical protein skT53_31630 [Effusibacillus dendaii]|uniref:Glucose-methanol-choline oxidoreductase N-terminal domain-containing protein n=1 Tax=Effusibacillus dendaii TaxID=2743772 RepID=A0A7I8DDA4_9BACL|nr:hypothetical protein skT53_31630 [Effusibacillus dendaii]
MSKLQRNNRKLVFDYVVIGTGPAGTVIAKTLADDKKTSVLVLEAGENNDRDKPIRGSTFAPELEERFFAKYFWQGEGVPQEGLDELTFEWTTGRFLGAALRSTASSMQDRRQPFLGNGKGF